MGFFTEIGILFTGMTVPAALALVLGFIFIVIEIFQPGFGVFGVIGGILVILGVVLRVLVGDGNPLAQIFILLFLMSIGVLVAFFLLARTAKKGWLARSPLVENSTAVSTDYSEGTVDYKALLGKLGVALTDLKPVGRANVDGEVYDVVTDGFYIKRGEGIKVIAVEGVKISVERAE